MTMITFDDYVMILMTDIPLYFEPSNKEFQSDDQRASGNEEHFGS